MPRPNGKRKRAKNQVRSDDGTFATVWLGNGEESAEEHSSGNEFDWSAYYDQDSGDGDELIAFEYQGSP
jgi:hypothetical protein